MSQLIAEGVTERRGLGSIRQHVLALVVLQTAAIVLCIAFNVTHPRPASAGLLDSIHTTFATTVQPIRANAARWSSTIFYSIVGAEFIYILYLGIWKHQWSDLLEMWVTRLCVFGIGVWLLQNQVALGDSIMAWIAQIASDFAVAGPGPALTPDGIASIGWTLSDNIWKVQSWDPVANVAAIIPQQLASISLQFAFLIVGVEDLVMQVGTQFCIAVGGIAVGLMATRWSRPFAAIWPRMMVGTLLLLVTVNAVAATGFLMAGNFTALIAKMSAASMFGDCATMTASSLAFIFFALAIPALVGFLGVTSPMAGGAVLASALSFVAFNMGRGSGGGGGGSSEKPSPVAQLEAATRTT